MRLPHQIAVRGQRVPILIATHKADMRCLVLGFLLMSFTYFPQLMVAAGLDNNAQFLSRIIRISSLLLIIVGCLPINVNRLRISDLVLIFGMATAVLMFILRQPSIEPQMDDLFWNGPLGLISLCLLSLRYRAINYNAIWQSLAILMTIQLLTGVSLYSWGISSSDNDGISGFMGNANMFAMLCLLIIARFVACGSPSVIFLPLSILGVVLSGSLAGVASLAIIGVLGVFTRRSFPLFLVIVVSTITFGSLAWILVEAIALEMPRSIMHLDFKIDSALQSLTGNSIIAESTSIQLRHEYLSTMLDGILSSDVALFGGFGGVRYFAADNQVISYVLSFGIFVTAMIATPIITVVMNLFLNSVRRWPSALPLLVVIIFLIVNRMCDYFTGAMLLALVLSELRILIPLQKAT